MALAKVNNPEVITVRAACEKYRNNYIGMRITKQNLIVAEDSEGVVLYTVDMHNERWLIPTREEGLSVSVGNGISDFPGGRFKLIEEESVK